MQKTDDINESPKALIPSLPVPKSQLIIYNEPKINLDFLNTKPIINTNNIKVVARFRPLNNVETELLERKIGGICVEYDHDASCIISNSVGYSQNFTLDRIFDSNTNQQTIFEEAAKSTIDDIFKGYNGTIFTYGQSGSGKTYTMYGPDLFDQEYKGIITRSIEYIFDYINNPINESIKFQIKFSMLEIYKECLYDLLDPENDLKELKIKETKDKQVYVKNLTEEYITNIDEFLLLIDQADKYRVVSETDLNSQSSRSHLLFTIEVIQQLSDGSEKSGKLHLVDLAGSEKISKSNAQGETLEEAKKINLSLSTLGNVISSLSKERDYIPYRDSKLTRILQDSLGGNYKTTLIVTCSPHMINTEETLSTLKFATRAKKIKNKVKQNIKKSSEQLQAIISLLKHKLYKANETIKLLNKRLLNVPKEIKEQYNLREESEESIDITEASDNNLSLHKLNSYNVSDLPNYKRELLLNSQISFNNRNEKNISIEQSNSNFTNLFEHIENDNKTNKMITECNSPNSEISINPQIILNDKDMIKENNSIKEIPNNKGIFLGINSIKHLSVENNQINKTIYDLEHAIQQLKSEKDQIVSQNIHLKEKCIFLQDKIKENNINTKRSLIYEIEKVENLMKDIEQLSNKCYESFSSLPNIQTNLLINQMKQENSLLRKANMEMEEKLNNFFNKMKVYDNERKIAKLYDAESDKITQEIKENFFNKFTLTKETDICFEDLINFFMEKKNFFSSNIFTSQQNEKLDKRKIDNLKETLLKVFALSIYYEVLLTNKINKEKIDLSLKSVVEEYNKKMNDYYSNFRKVFNKFQLLITEFKNIKLEEIIILSNKSAIYQQQNDNKIKESTTLKTTKNISNIQNSLFKKNNLLFYDSAKKALFKPEKPEDNFSVNESLEDEIANPSIISGIKQENNKMVNNVKFSINIPKRNISTNIIKKEYVKKNNIIESDNKLNEDLILSNESSESEGDINKNKQKEAIKENNFSPFNMQIPRSNTLKNVTLINKIKHPLKSSLLSKKILENPLLDERNLNEIKKLKNEISMYKLYIQTINDKLETDLYFNKKTEKALEHHIKNTKIIFKEEIENLHKCYDVYQSFYEEEIKTRNATIQELTSYIESLKSSTQLVSVNPNVYSEDCPISNFTIQTEPNKSLTQIKKNKTLRNYFIINKDLANNSSSDYDNKSLISIFNDESGSATK